MWTLKRVWPCLPLVLAASGCRTGDTAAESAKSGTEALSGSDLPAGANDYEMELEFSEPVHPDEADGQATRALLLSTRQPSDESLDQCLSNLQNIGEAVKEARQVDDAVSQLLKQVQENFEIYHWCFYQQMDRLDRLLDQSMDLRRDAGPKFLKGMKELLVLARALDKEDGSQVYQTYLKIRYQQLNRDYFGSKLREIYGRKPEEKAAASYQEH